MYFTFRFPFWWWWSPAVTRIGWKQCRAIEVAENRCGFQKETGYITGFPTRAHASTGPSSSAFLCTFNTWSWKTHYWHHVLGLIHLGLDSPKMLSTSNTCSYFSTCVNLTGIIHALKTKHVLCWKVPWMCCRGKASVHPEEYVRGLPVLRSLKLQKLMSLAALRLNLSGAVPWYCRHSEGESTSCFSLPTQENPLLVQQRADV